MTTRYKVIGVVSLVIIAVFIFITAINTARRKSELEDKFDFTHTTEMQEEQEESVFTVEEPQTVDIVPGIFNTESTEEVAEPEYTGSSWDNKEFVEAVRELEAAAEQEVFRYLPTGEQAKTPISVLHGYFSGVEGNGALSSIEAFAHDFIILDDWYDGMVYKVLFESEDKMYLCLASEDSMVYHILDKTSDYSYLPSKPFKSAAERVGKSGIVEAAEEIEVIKPLALMTIVPDTSVPLKPLSTLGRYYSTEDGYKMLNAIEAFNSEADIYYDAYEGALYVANFDVAGTMYQCISDEALTVFYIVEGSYF